MESNTLMQPDYHGKRIAFVSTRIAGTDGVSLEIAKWAHVIEQVGIECFYITGESDRPVDRTAIIEEAHFNHPEILDIARRSFGSANRDAKLTDDIMEMTRRIRNQLNEAIEKFDVHAIIAENALTIPMNLPLGVALVASLQEKRIGCLAHHHDFYWERDRFLVNAVDDYLRYAFPPALAQIQHVVINSPQGEEFSRRTGLSCRIIPNVMDFANPPQDSDDYASQFRSDIGIGEDGTLILQPTRVVARKGIEHAIELVHRLNRPGTKLVISHRSSDEGNEYLERVNEYAQLMGVDVVFVADRIADQRGVAPDGTKLYTLGDVLSQADLVTYPSEYEGFGNAFLEAIYHKVPVVCNRYTIYRTDIEPCGFRSIVFDGYLTDATINEVRRVLDDEELRREIVEHNYRVARKFFSYEVLEAELKMMVERPHNIYRLLSRKQRAFRD